MVDDMLNKKWHVTPDAILLVKNMVANGQHRLDAVAQSGIPEKFIVMRSNDEELYKFVDLGKRRTAADALTGRTYSREMPSVARWVMGYESDQLAAETHGQISAVTQTVLRFTIPMHELIDYCEKNSAILTEAVKYVHPLYSATKLLPLSIGAAIHALAETRGKATEARDFLRGVYLDGGALSAIDLRNRLIHNRGGKSKLGMGYVFGITIKAFNSFLNGTRPARLKWHKDEALPKL